MLNMTKYEIVVFKRTQKVAILECEMEGSTLPVGDACGRCFGCWWMACRSVGNPLQ